MYRLPDLLYAVHSYKVTHTAGKYKAVENFMGTKVLVQPVKYRELTGINDAADSVNNAAGEQPEECALV